jgi:hypothetical protein
MQEQNTKGIKILVGKPGGKRPPSRQRNRWKGNIKMDFKEI